jgi:hypothetical protein
VKFGKVEIGTGTATAPSGAIRSQASTLSAPAL